MTVISATTIKKRICNPEDIFCITPILDWEKQVSASSVDLRLDNQFIIITRTSFPIINPIEKDLPSKISQYQKLEKIQYGEKFVLHPHELVIGSTLEYLSFPNDLTAYLIGRSSWGRLGLIIATATVIDPCFKGNLTLELINSGNVPIELYPGVRIAQLIFHKLDDLQDECKDEGKYQMQIGPGFSKIYKDEELSYLSLTKYKLALGLTGHKGSGKSIISNFLIEDRLFKYFSLSHIVRKRYREEKSRVDATRKDLQDFGDELRCKYGPDYLARLVIKEIHECNLDRNAPIVIDGIRNPKEVDRLARLPNFYLIGISATKDKIIENLKNRGYIPKQISEKDFEEAYLRDCGKREKENGMGQNIEGCLNKVLPDYKIEFKEDVIELLKQFEVILQRLE